MDQEKKTVACPGSGAFTAWKMCDGGCVVKLRIPEDAERCGGAGGLCRASRAEVLEVVDSNLEPVEEAASIWDSSFRYRKGETVVPNGEYEKDPGKLGPGIYFHMTKQDAYDYVGMWYGWGPGGGAA